MPDTQDPDQRHLPRETLERVRAASMSVRAEIGKVIVGQEEVIDEILIAIFCQSHALLVGVPGLAKTLLVSTISRALSLDFNRVQFTPDLMPSDITGTEVIQEDRASGRRELTFVKGPIFANIILADEINRTPPKTQAALLEAMQERQVTIGGKRHALPTPFFVLATQNPLEQEGTYPLPEAQLDRFMFQTRIGYPRAETELEVVRRSARKRDADVRAVLSHEEIAFVQAAVREVPVPEYVLRYAVRLVRSTRVSEPLNDGLVEQRPKLVQDYLSWGAGPRASEYLILAAKARAILHGEGIVTPAHVRSVALPVLRHRILTNFNAEADQVTPDQIVAAMLREISEEPVTREERALLDANTR